MPESYTHSNLANRALMRSGQMVASFPAFLAGTNGPSPFSAYLPKNKKGELNLPKLAEAMHREKTGEFLFALINSAVTPIQQSYVLGFLSHYAVDCVMHPYINAMCGPGGPYNIDRGHGWMESAMDSSLYFENYRTYIVPLHEATPVLVTEELAQVSATLRTAIAQTYDVEIPVVDLAEMFHNLLRVRKFLISPRGGKRVLARMAERVLLGKEGKGFIESHMQPAKPLKSLPTCWVNQGTGQEKNCTLEELLTQATEASAICISATMRYWLGKISGAQLAVVLGNNDYYTGLPCQAVYVEEQIEHEPVRADIMLDDLEDEMPAGAVG